MCVLVFLDLFDNEGFSLSDVNDTLVGPATIEAVDSVYFIDDDMEAARCREKGEAESEQSSPDLEEVDLHRTWVCVHTTCTYSSSTVVGNS